MGATPGQGAYRPWTERAETARSPVWRARCAPSASGASSSPTGSEPSLLCCGGGTYELDEPIVLTPDDSGTAASPTLLAAYPGERPVLSGGTRITGWTVGASRRWGAVLPAVRRGDWSFAQLWVNGTRRYRPRLPKHGYFTVARGLPAEPGGGFAGFAYDGTDIRSDWHDLNEVEILGFQIWTMARFRVAAVDQAARTVRFQGKTANSEFYSAIPAGNRYIVENVREALSEPGEWYLDRPAGRLTYQPAAGEDPRRTEVVAPRLEHLLAFRGDVAGRRWVSHVVLRGLTFAHTNWTTPPGGHAFPQAEADLGAAVRAVGARHCRLEGCTITHTGGWALDLGEGCKRVVVDGCTLTDLGAGGIKVGTTGYAQDEEAVAGEITVSDCVIAHGGRLHPAGIGVWIGHSPHNVIANNEIADFYYTGISVGWSWGYGPSHAHHNTLEYNHIHDIGQRVLSDMGGTYTLGVAPGSVQRGNVIHDINSFGYGGWGIYFDEGTTGMLAEGNLVYRTKSAGFHQHYGRENVARNNVFAFGHEAEVMRTRAEEHLSFTFERNIVYWREGPLLGSNWSGHNYRFDRNLYWNASGAPVTFAGLTLEEWRAKGQDLHSVIADPRFVAPGRGDFGLRAGSPASQIGFVAIDASRAGPRGALRKPPVKPTPGYPQPPPPPPSDIADGFEETPVGARPRGATVHEEGPPAIVRVTDEQAAAGEHSLKFVDTPGQQHNYNPHIYYGVRFPSCVLVSTFALRVAPGTTVFHEWRDSGSPYHVGPSIRVEPDGSLLASGRRLMALPHQTWVRFEVTCGVGSRANGRWDLVVRLPGRTPPLRFPGLPCNPSFRDLEWFGFSADADAAGLFYLDDLRLAPRG